MLTVFLIRYLQNLGTLASQAINTMFLFGDPDETVSSRAGKNRHKPGWRQLAAILDRIWPGHTAAAREDDEGARQIVKD